MRRRRLLLGLAATFPGLAGCTYAPGGGDLFGETTLPSAGEAPMGPLFEGYDTERFVTARSGRQWIRDETGELSFDVATTATLVDRSGTVLWRYRQRRTTDGLAVGDRLYLVGERRVTASPPIEPAATGVPRTEQVTARAWEYPVEGRPEHVAGAGHTVILGQERRLVGLRNGEARWTREFPEPVIAVRRADGKAIVHVGSEAAAFRPDGAIAWRQPADPAAGAVAAGPSGVGVIDEGRLRFLADGEVRWGESMSEGHLVTIGEEALAVGVGAELQIRDLANGERLATLRSRPDPDAVLVPDEGGGYVATPDGAVRALDGRAGERWRRTLEVDRGTRPLDGWLEPETVALLFANGTIYRIQRHSAGRPLFL